MKKTITNQLKKLSAAVIGLGVFTLCQAADRPTLMSYQGNLLDANGDPVGKEAPVNKIVQFYIYDAEEDGNTIWGEEQTVTVDNGYFSVILGEGTKLTGDNLFQDMEPGKSNADARYIGLIVDGVDITPRLRLLTTPYSQLSQRAVWSLDAKNAQTAGIADTLSNNTDARSGYGFVPIGGIIMWNTKDIPDGWAICDGNDTPDLRGRFVMGVGATSGKHNDHSWTNNHKLGDKYGSKTVQLLKRHMPAHNHTINNKNLGSHSHSGTTSSGGKHLHYEGGIVYNAGADLRWGLGSFNVTNGSVMEGDSGHGYHDNEKNEKAPKTSSEGSHTHTFSTSSKSLGSHNHTMGNTGDGNVVENRPPFYTMYYIQRMR
tara:strand:- start:109 stop:1224 length:1116 start_codon:yes stop_codon:yes gene_type:complete